MIYFPDVADRNDIADLLNIRLKNLTFILFVKGTSHCYTSFEIPKRSGGVRIINAPNDELKAIQRKLANRLWEYQQEIWEKEKIQPNLAHGFIKGKSIFSNAAIHRNKRYILNMDLSDFFDSIHFGRVCGYFEKNKYFKLPHEAAVTIAQIACYNGSLPQGAPSSPIISNLICQTLDIHLLKLAKQFKMDYSRYADDITFSTNNHAFLDDLDAFVEQVKAETLRMGFLINDKKTRLIYRDSRQTVTGLIVNKKINIDRDFYRTTRAMANHLYRGQDITINGVPATMAQLEGRLAFIDQIDLYNNRRDKEIHDVYRLCGREKDYQKFLFYKYFYSSEKPLIITEGKTDIAYIKAALKNMYQDYPNLITKDDETGTYEFKISFLRRTSKLKYYFKINPDGADAFKYLIECYKSEKGNPTNFFRLFQRQTTNPPKCHVILLLDNETESDKPLKKYIKLINLSQDEKNNLLSNLYHRLKGNTNLFLLTINLPNGNKECEIEDLFSESVLKQVIDGRTFERNVEKGDKNHYGKEVFSKYVYSNFEKINFSSFRPVLDALNTIVSTQL